MMTIAIQVGEFIHPINYVYSNERLVVCVKVTDQRTLDNPPGGFQPDGFGAELLESTL
jgi:hypothetical protein